MSYAGETRTAFIAMALHKSPLELTAAGLARRMRDSFPEIGDVEALAPQASASPPPGGDPAGVLSIDGRPASFMRVDAPLPAATLALARGNSSAAWRDAGASLDEHIADAQTHTIVHMSGPENDLDHRRAYAVAATCMAAAIAQEPGGLAVYWNAGQTLSAPSDALAAARAALTGAAPLNLWVGLETVDPDPDAPSFSPVTLRSHGLAAFVDLELAWLASSLPRAQAQTQMLAAARMMIEEARELADGAQLSLGAPDGGVTTVLRSPKEPKEMTLAHETVSLPPDEDGARDASGAAGAAKPSISRIRRWFGLH